MNGVAMHGELEQLGERIAEHAAHFDAATHRLLADLRDFDRRGGWHAQGALSCAHWLAWRVGWDLVTARERVRVAGKLADFPLIDDALRRGELSKHLGRASHREASASPDSAESRGTTHTGYTGVVAAPVQAVAPFALTDSAESSGLTDMRAAAAAAPVSDVTARLGDDSAESRGITCTDVVAAPVQVLAPFSLADSSESRAIACTDVVAAPVQAVEPCTIADSAESRTAPSRLLLDCLLEEPEAARGLSLVTAGGSGDTLRATASAVREPSVLHQQVDATRRAFSRADALLSVAQAYLRGDRPHRVPVEVTITIPASSLRRDAADAGDAADAADVGWMGYSCVSTEAARRLSCDAGVIEVVEDEHGVPLSVGRKRRTIAGSIKRALLQRDTACSFPGCTHQTFLEGHHLVHWADGGETTLDNAALLCSLCRARHKLH
jgi:hypothetical protein